MALHSDILQHKTREIKHALLNDCFKVYWTNVLVNTKWRVIDAKTVKGQLRVRVLHPIHAGWYAVDTKDTITLQ